jgi:dienelactone hydrolase
MQSTEFTSGGKPIRTEVFEPVAPNGGAVVIAYGSDGLADNTHGPWATMMRGYAIDLAAQGFTALIPRYFDRTGTKEGDIDFRPGGTGAEQIWLHRDEWQSALADAVKHAQSMAGVSPGRAGLLGFSLGAHLCLRLRESARVVVEFFGPVLDGIGIGGGPGVRVQIHHGTGDSLVRFDANATPIQQQLVAAKVPTELFPYKDAEHGFARSVPADQQASKLSKERAIEFFKAQL